MPQDRNHEHVRQDDGQRGAEVRQRPMRTARRAASGERPDRRGRSAPVAQGGTGAGGRGSHGHRVSRRAALDRGELAVAGPAHDRHVQPPQGIRLPCRAALSGCPSRERNGYADESKRMCGFAEETPPPSRGMDTQRAKGGRRHAQTRGRAHEGLHPDSSSPATLNAVSLFITAARRNTAARRVAA